MQFAAKLESLLLEFWKRQLIWNRKLERQQSIFACIYLIKAPWDRNLWLNKYWWSLIGSRMKLKIALPIKNKVYLLLTETVTWLLHVLDFWMSTRSKLKSFLLKEIPQLYLRSLWTKSMQVLSIPTLKWGKKLRNYSKLFIQTLVNN